MLSESTQRPPFAIRFIQCKRIIVPFFSPRSSETITTYAVLCTSASYQALPCQTNRQTKSDLVEAKTKEEQQNKKKSERKIPFD